MTSAPIVILTVWLLGVGVLFALPTVPPEPVIVTHWASGHTIRPNLLPRFAEQFNQLERRTSTGRPVLVRTIYQGSAEAVDELVSRITRGVPIDPKLPDPTVVTASADHWLAYANYASGRTVVDLTRTRSIARTWIGIATYREMAECLGWPRRQIGFDDIVALRADPQGWARYPCARAEWGQRPLIAFTDPLTSSTGRSTLFSFYAIAAGKPPEQLTEADVTDPRVVAYVKQLQRVVDHYVIGTLPLNTQIYQGPRYGHFFFLPEDNLVSLYQGKENVRVGFEIRELAGTPIRRPMVMLYPKEGSTAHSHSAGIVQASWVSAEQAEAAERWVDFLHEDAQQRALMEAGFRPATRLPLSDPISGRYGLDPAQPRAIVNPDLMEGAVMAAIIRDWDDVKKPGVVAFVVDSSVSMQGEKLARAKEGLVRALDAVSKHTQVGFISFADAIDAQVPVAPLPTNRFAVAGAVERMQARGGGALYDAIRAGIDMVDTAAAEQEAIRGVVVLTDGQANRGQIALHDLVRMMSRDEVPIREFRGFEDDAFAIDELGRSVPKGDLVGTGLAPRTRHPVLIFFVSLGDADLEVGRILAEATGAASQGARVQDLASVIAEFGKYF